MILILSRKLDRIAPFYLPQESFHFLLPSAAARIWPEWDLPIYLPSLIDSVQVSFLQQVMDHIPHLTVTKTSVVDDKCNCASYTFPLDLGHRDRAQWK